MHAEGAGAGVPAHVASPAKFTGCVSGNWLCWHRAWIKLKKKKKAQKDWQIQSLYLNSVTKTVYLEHSAQRTDPSGETSDGRIFTDIGA